MCFFQRHQTLSALWSSQSPVQGGSSVQAGSALCSEDQPWVCQNWYQLFSGLRCSTDKNPALNIGKLWFVLLYGELSYPISSIWLFPIICPFLSHFFSGSQSELLINFSSPFPWFPVRHFPVNPSLYFEETLYVFFYFLNFVVYFLLS